MELKFTKDGEKFISEFTATADFNLHLEGVVEGNVKVYQRGSATGEYAYVREATPYPSFSDVYDYDFSALVYPKSIKVVTNVEPVVAEVVTDGEVIPSAGGGARNIKYYDVTGIDGTTKGILLGYCSAVKHTVEVQKSIYGVCYLATMALNGAIKEEFLSHITEMAFDFDAPFLITLDEKMMVGTFEGGFAELGVTEITEEEFYNLN